MVKRLVGRPSIQLEWIACRKDERGFHFIVGRKKDMIRRAGENVAAAEIEAVLQAHDCVAQVAVVAAPDELREEEVLASTYEIEVAGVRHRAVASLVPMHDPKSERVRG